MYEDICKLYEYLSGVIKGNSNYVFRPKKTQITMINNFLKLINQDSQGREWLFDYFVFHFSRMYDADRTYMGKPIVQLNWVVGKKALEKWRNRTEQHIFYADKFRREFKIKNILIPEKKLSLSNEYYDIVRSRGDFLSCDSLNLYNKFNRNCILCLNKSICSEL